MKLECLDEKDLESTFPMFYHYEIFYGWLCNWFHDFDIFV